jgi:hypothetical protein
MRSLYREASQAENVGALRGAAVEELVADRGAEGRDLYAQINALGERGVECLNQLF